MIFTFILNTFYLFVSTVLSALPNSTGLDPSFGSSVINVVSYMKAWNFLLPIDTLFQILPLALLYFAALFAFDVIHYIVGVVRGHGMS